MSVPGLNPFVPPAPAPAPVPPQIQPPRPGSPRLRNRPAQHDEQTQEGAASDSGLKRGRPSEVEEEGMGIETSSEPAIKRRRSEREVATPELLQALIEAADLAGLRELLNENVRIDEPILDGLTPLMYACSIGHLDIARLLRQRGAKLADDQYSCLHWAASGC